MGTRSLIILSLKGWLFKIIKGLFSYSGITVICLFLFCGFLTWFYWKTANVKMDWVAYVQFKDRWRNAILGLGTLNIFAVEWFGIKSNLQEQLLNIYKIVLILTYIIIAMVYFMVLQQPYEVLLSMDVGVFIVTGMILISGIRNDVFID